MHIGNLCVCRRLDLTLTTNQSYAVLGNNGVGKTTLLHTLAGLHPATQGAVYLQQQRLEHCSRRKIAQSIGLLTQDAESGFDSTVLERVLLGRHPHLTPWQSLNAQDIDQAQHALAQVELQPLIHHLTQTLSGGEYQRLKLAQLLTQAPQAYLLDEPTNHLDWYHKLRILGYLMREIKPQAGLIMSLHDINLAAQYCDYGLLLWGKGDTLHGPIEAVLTADHLTRLYRIPIVKLETEQGAVYLPKTQ